MKVLQNKMLTCSEVITPNIYFDRPVKQYFLHVVHFEMLSIMTIILLANEDQSCGNICVAYTYFCSSPFILIDFGYNLYLFAQKFEMN